MADDFRFRIDQRAMHRMLTATAGPVGKDLSRRAIMVDRTAKTLCPVDTGRLRSSINWRLGVDTRGLYATIGTNVEYAPHVEYGTRYMAAQPFLRPALNAGR